MLTIFTTCKPSKGHFAIIQENAIASWCLLKPRCQIILLGNDYGTEKIAKKYGALHIPNIAVNKFGTPLLPDLFKKAYENANFKTLAYVNCDMILMSDFIEAIAKIEIPTFFLTGARIDLDIKHRIQFKGNWQTQLKTKVEQEGKIVGKYGATDYFVFRPKINFQMPNLILGRTFWDTWLIFRAKSFKIPVIDATKAILAVHQSHDYSHAGGWNNVWLGPESRTNKKLIGDRRKYFNLQDADYVLTNKGLKRPKLTVSRIIRKIETAPVLTPKITPLIYPLNFLIRAGKFLRDKLSISF